MLSCVVVVVVFFAQSERMMEYLLECASASACSPEVSLGFHFQCDTVEISILCISSSLSCLPVLHCVL